MRSLPENFEAHIKSGTTTLCNCWKLIRNDGAVKGFTDHDKNLEIEGTVYEASSGFIGTQAISRIGLSVDNMEIHSALSSNSLLESDLSNGLYDNAAVELYLVNWKNPEQKILQRTGNVGEVKRGTLTFMAEVRGLAHNLQQPQGRVFQQTCDADIGDGRCKIDLNTPFYSAIATVTQLETSHSFISDGLFGYASNWFNGGKIEWITGNNMSAVLEIKGHIKQSELITVISLWQQLGQGVNVGDQFKVTAGCDKIFGTCKNKFLNQMNFRGFPHIPGNDFLIKSPNKNDGTQDGSSQNE